MKNKTLRRILRTYSIILMGSIMGFLARWASGQFSYELNVILFFTLFVLLSLMWEILRLVNFQLDKVLPFDQGIPRRIMVQLVIGALCALLFRYLIYEFGEPYLPFTVDSLFMVSTWALYVMGSFIVNSIFFLQFFIIRWKDTLVEAERLEKEKSQVQFDNLKNQLNPHFLFNALTSLNSLIGENPALASQFLQHLSKVYRYVLQHKEKKFVSLDTELEFIRNYVFLAQTRFARALQIQLKIPDAVREKAIVPVTLQILIENALKHNVMEESRPLTIEIAADGDFLTVSNNLQARKIVETSNKLGLENLKSLYGFLTDRPVMIERDAGMFRVKVPLL